MTIYQRMCYINFYVLIVEDRKKDLVEKVNFLIICFI